MTRIFIVFLLGSVVACSNLRPGSETPVSEPTTLDEYWISTPAELTELKLSTPNKQDEVHLELILATIEDGLRENDYIFLFDPEQAEAGQPLILNPSGVPLIAIRRWVRLQPTCTTWITVRKHEDETDQGYGGRIRAGTRGICGGIAAMHSLLLLGLVDRNDVIDGDNFKEGPLRQIQGRNTTQMSERRLRELHEGAGATTCQTQGGTGFPTNNAAGMQRFNRELRQKMNDPNHTWDCTVFMRTRRNGKWVLGHFEHVESVTGNDAATTITTTNGLAQGNQTDTVPASPGSNTWSSNPGGTPPFKLTGSTHDDAEAYKSGIPAVGIVKYLCCRQ